MASDIAVCAAFKAASLVVFAELFPDSPWLFERFFGGPALSASRLAVAFFVAFQILLVFGRAMRTSAETAAAGDVQRSVFLSTKPVIRILSRQFELYYGNHTLTNHINEQLNRKASKTNMVTWVNNMLINRYFWYWYTFLD